MARRDPVALKSDQIRLEDIANHDRDTENALCRYYSDASPVFMDRFIGYLEQDVDVERRSRLAELDVTCTRSLLAKLEAALRVGYIPRCRARKRDALIRHLQGHRVKVFSALMVSRMRQHPVSNHEGRNDLLRHAACGGGSE